MEAEARAGREGAPHGDDSLMERFDRWDLRRFSGWDAVKAVALTMLILLIFAGGARCGRRPTSSSRGSDATSSRRSAARRAGSPTGSRSPTPAATSRPGSRPTRSSRARASGRPRAARDGPAAPVPTTPQPLHNLLVTGDSLSTPLDIEIARKLADQGADVQVTRDPHLATGISNTGLVDWGQLSASQAANDDPDAGGRSSSGRTRAIRCPDANGQQVSCCGPAWEAIFRSRVRPDDGQLPAGRRPADLLADGSDAAGYARLGKQLATMTRVGEPSELAAAIVFLASDDASFISGSVIPVDGAWLAGG